MRSLLSIFKNNDTRHTIRLFLFTDEEVRLLLTSRTFASFDLGLVFAAGPMDSHFLTWRLDRLEADWFEAEHELQMTPDEGPELAG